MTLRSVLDITWVWRINSHSVQKPIDLAKRLPNSEIILYKDAGHGGIFQYHEEFVKRR